MDCLSMDLVLYWQNGLEFNRIRLSPRAVQVDMFQRGGSGHSRYHRVPKNDGKMEKAKGAKDTKIGGAGVPNLETSPSD